MIVLLSRGPSSFIQTATPDDPTPPMPAAWALGRAQQHRCRSPAQRRNGAAGRQL